MFGVEIANDVGPAPEDPSNGHLLLPTVLDQPGSNRVPEQLGLVP